MPNPVPIKKIGVFDSGLGGLTVLKQLLKTHPRRSYVYFGDTAHVPYGNRDADDVVALVSDIARHLVGEGCQALVVACNTSSALALSALRTVVDVPVVGVIDAACAEAVQVTQRGRIVVLSTPLTARSGVYAKGLQQAAALLGTGLVPEVLELGCPELVPIVEEGDSSSPESQDILRKYVSRVHEREADTVILGCTHYPLLLPVLEPLLGPEVAVIDPAGLIPRILGEWYFPTNGTDLGTVTYQVSGEPEAFESRAEKFLGQTVNATRVIL